MSSQTSVHVPVLRQPILKFASEAKPKIIFDGTLGGGGHALAFAEMLRPHGLVIATDRDLGAVDRFKAMFQSSERSTFTEPKGLHAVRPDGDLQESALVIEARNADSLTHNLLRTIEPESARRHLDGNEGVAIAAIHASYHELPLLLTQMGLSNVDMILLDLGLSSDQLADNERGFSFKSSGELDLRFDVTQGQPAWEHLQTLDEEEIANILYRYGDERFSRRIAKRVCQQRKTAPVKTAEQLRELIHASVPGAKHGRIDAATRSFQALRIFVNDELQIIAEALIELPKVMALGGIMQIISFHSLEDRLVKNAFRDHLELEVLTRKPIVADDTEIAQNPRSRSAKLRVARKTEPNLSKQQAVRSDAEYRGYSHF